MPEITSEKALVLSSRRFGERKWIVTVFTENNGKIAGVLNKKQPPETGTFVSVRWRARLSEQLGMLFLEEITPFSVGYLDDKKRLACLSALCALLNDTLPERQAFSELYRKTFLLLGQLDEPDFLRLYALFERDLLEELGFGFDLTVCSGGGNSEDLAYVSPKTGRAVSREKGLPYHQKLLVLPRFFWKDEPANDKDIRDGLRLTGYFLSQHTFHHKLPDIRERLISD